MTNQDQPLWRALLTAYVDSRLPPRDSWRIPHGFAAELRTVADAIPEDLYGAGGVRAWLLKEAERAEAGE